MNKDSLSPSSFIGVRNEDTISFGSGEPDLPPPDEVYKILPYYSDFKYGLIQGQENLRNALSKQYPDSSPNSFVPATPANPKLGAVTMLIAWVIAWGAWGNSMSSWHKINISLSLGFTFSKAFLYPENIDS